MDSKEAGQLCEQLFVLVKRGPGVDPEALREALSIVSTLTKAAPSNLHGRLLGLEENFPLWFSARKWDTPGDVGGQRLRQFLYDDITVVQGPWPWPPAADDDS